MQNHANKILLHNQTHSQNHNASFRCSLHSSASFLPINFLFGLYQRIWPLASLLFYPLSSKIAWKWPITIYQFWVANHLTPLKPSSSVTCCDLWSITHRLTATNLFSYTYSFINSLKISFLSYPVMNFLNVFYWDSSLHSRPVILRLLTKDLIFQVNY